MDRLFEETDINPALMMRDMLNSTNAMTNYTINHPDVQKLLKSDKKFDLVISEVFLNDAFLGRHLNNVINKVFKFIVLQVSPHTTNVHTLLLVQLEPHPGLIV